MQKLLKTYLRRLTNLTSRNRSLLLLNLPQEQFLDLNELNFLDGKPSFEYINQLIVQKTTIPLCDLLDSRMEKVNEASKRLKKIARTEAFIEEERGSEDLYVGYPFVKGKLSDGTVVRCPLLFFPVTLKNNSKKWILEKRDEAISLNRSFLLAYSHFNQIRISDEFLETSFEDFDKVSLVFRTQLYELLKESKLEINFNQDLFTDQLIDFQKLTKADLELSELNGELKLFPQAVLGIFPQAGSYLVPDYEKLLTPPLPLPDGEGYNKENVFFRTLPIGEGREGLVKEETTFLPFAVDASQEAAIKQIKEGKSLVVQGPPGTGKSQLIANLVADFTARGKRVLVVCQKRVALDTVFQRLEKVKMGNFVALIHDFKNDRKALFEKIANQIEQIEDYQKKNKGLDAIFLERNFTQISRRIDKISEELQGFKIALFDESICGLSVKELYLTSSLEKPYIKLKELYKSFVFNELADFEGRLKRYFQYEEKLQETEEYEFWKNRVSFAKFTNSDLSKIIGTVEDVENFQAKNTTDFSLIALNSFDEKQVEQFLKLLENNDIVKIFEAILYEKKYLENRQFDLTKIKDEIENLNTNDWIETILPQTELLVRKTQIEKAYLASKSGLNWFVWKLFSKDKKDIEKLVFQNKLSLQTTDLELLSKKIDNRISFEQIKEKLAKKDILIDPQDDFDWISQTLKNYILANKANVIYQANGFLKKPDFSLPYYHYLETLILETKQKMLVWKLYLTKEQIEDSGEATSEMSIRFLRQNFDYLVETDQLKESFSRTEWEVVKKLSENPKDAIAIFQNSLRLAWTEHIENLYPILRSVSSLKMSQMEEELQTSIKQKQALSEEILLLKLREQTYKDLIINRLQNVVTYRELQHQTTKKRKIWSVRKVLEHYSDEIFKLIPCWMASPESVSAMFPMNVGMDEKLFDLVIFDEASQCFAEYGIPAIFRGKQVLIAGDSKQLQPNDLYQIRYEEDLIDEPILEIDSLLDLAAQYLPQVSLQGHYRSRSLDLIDFSNQFFYKNSLRLLPDYEEINKNKPSINYIKVEGVWEKNTNEIEVQMVLGIIKNLKEISPEKSIGVVTFNHKQADLIELRMTNEIQKQTQVSIKNIENIQGDEFDIVIFSIGYAPDAQGKMLMNFGSLNQQGGENRLNVGITRAREKIYIVSSIFPNQLRVEDAQNQGPKLLKKYLEYALEVSDGKYLPKIVLNENFRMDWFLKEQLKKDNPLYISELPFADITVKNNTGNYESLILTDDDLYYASISPKEAHAYLLLNLQEKGWKVERLWSRTYLR
ncbi:AAA domain-containing protein [Emticicia sp. SJ17W-69]|uniref:AAA domain-containing protein n=1 Tax=Emticicia sp. SJ17W-69 TaxID=3421657 RepID=UPI003EC09BD0